MSKEETKQQAIQLINKHVFVYQHYRKDIIKAKEHAILEVQSKIDLLKHTKTKLQKEYLECENHLEQQGYANCNMLLNIELNQQKEILKYLKEL